MAKQLELPLRLWQPPSAISQIQLRAVPNATGCRDMSDPASARCHKATRQHPKLRVGRPKAAIVDVEYAPRGGAL